MILIVDNSEERRKNLVIRLRVKGYLVCGINYDDIDYYTKPFMTVYINPPRQIIDKLKNEDTISVIFTDRLAMNLPLWTINVLSIKNLENDIINMYHERCHFQAKDKVDVIGYACLRNGCFALGGKIFRISNMQMPILCLFLFNKNKKFRLYEACQYMHFRTNPEESFARQVMRINSKTQKRNRGKVILNEDNFYFLNPDIANYICKEDDDVDVIEEGKGPFYLKLDLSYDL